MGKLLCQWKQKEKFHLKWESWNVIFSSLQCRDGIWKSNNDNWKQINKNVAVRCFADRIYHLWNTHMALHSLVLNPCSNSSSNTPDAFILQNNRARQEQDLFRRLRRFVEFENRPCSILATCTPLRYMPFMWEWSVRPISTILSLSTLIIQYNNRQRLATSGLKRKQFTNVSPYKG